MNLNALCRHSENALVRYEQTRRATGNPWFSVPLNLSAVAADVRDCYSADALALAEMASADQGCLLKYLHAAACAADSVPVTEALMLRTLSERARDLQLSSARCVPNLPWRLGKSLNEQIGPVEAFLCTVDSYWHTELVFGSGIACFREGMIVLSPLFHVLAGLS